MIFVVILLLSLNSGFTQNIVLKKMTFAENKPGMYYYKLNKKCKTWYCFHVDGASVVFISFISQIKKFKPCKELHS